MSPERLILLCMVVPAIGAALLPFFSRWPNLRETVTIVTSLALFLVVGAVREDFAAGVRPVVELAEVMPGLSLSFQVEPLGMLFALVASTLWIVTSFYAIGYMRAHHETSQTRFFACFAGAIAATMGIALASNVFTLFVFYEVLTFSTWPLVTHARTDAAKRSGRIYLGILVGTSVCFLLFAVIWTWFAAGTLDFTPGGILRGKVEGPHVAILLALYMFGTGKAALMPFHRWLPAAMVAPTPVSALLHAVAVVKAGVFTVLKVSVYVFGVDFLWETAASRWLQWVAAATIVLASLVAMTKDNLKARLAYSTISQLSYITLGASMATELGMIGGGVHIAMHAVGKITLFFCAGAVYVALHKTDVSQMKGIGRQMPFTMVAFFVGACSIIGLPPMGGAWSKWYLALGALEADQVALVAVLMLSSLLNVAYLLPIPVMAFLGRPDPAPDRGDHGGHGHGAEPGKLHEAPLFCVVPLCLTAAGCVLLFLFPEPLVELVRALPLGGPGGG